MSTEPTFRSVRRSRTFHLLAQAALLLSLFGGLNYLVGHSGGRFDLTASHRHSLSAETLLYLKNLTQPVRLISTFDDSVGADTLRDINELLAEYTHATEQNPASGRVIAEFLNVTERAREAKQLGLDEQPNTLLVVSGEGPAARRHFIDLSELYQVEKREKTAFLGEQAVTAAILDVTNSKRKIIYFLGGHHEMAIDGPESMDADRGLQTLRRELQLRNFDIAILDLTRYPGVPSDAALVVIAGPQGRVQPDEVKWLSQYLDGAGRVLALLAPKSPHGLDDLLEKWGVLVDDVLVCDNDPARQNDTGDLILTANDNVKEDHPVSHALASNKIAVRFGAARTARPDPARGANPGLVVTPIVGTGSNAWGERDYNRAGAPVFDRRVDLPGPFAVATASERVPSGGLKPVPSGRLVVFGGADWAANSRLTTPGNLTLFLAAVNWTVDRGAGLALGDVPARPIERIQLTLDSQQLQRLRYALVFALPGAAALLGLAVFWARRR